jgi:hypothetical protein
MDSYRRRLETVNRLVQRVGLPEFGLAALNAVDA